MVIFLLFCIHYLFKDRGCIKEIKESSKNIVIAMRGEVDSVTARIITAQSECISVRKDRICVKIVHLRRAYGVYHIFECIIIIADIIICGVGHIIGYGRDSGSNYLEVSDTTGASSATISRVNRCLNYGSGYRMALDNLKKAGILDDDGSDLEE